MYVVSERWRRNKKTKKKEKYKPFSDSGDVVMWAGQESDSGELLPFSESESIGQRECDYEERLRKQLQREADAEEEKEGCRREF